MGKKSTIRYPDRASTIDDQAQEPVRRTEAGKYGDNSELSPHKAVSDEQKAGMNYFAPAKLRNKVINDMRRENGEEVDE